MRAVIALTLLVPLVAGAADAAFDHAAVKKDCGVVELPEGPVPGMTEQRMLSCTWLGRAKALRLANTTQVLGSVARQYEDTLGVLKYVYTRDGVVTGVQR